MNDEQWLKLCDHIEQGEMLQYHIHVKNALAFLIEHFAKAHDDPTHRCGLEVATRDAARLMALILLISKDTIESTDGKAFDVDAAMHYFTENTLALLHETEEMRRKVKAGEK